MNESRVPEPTYTTPELVAETMGLPDPADEYGFYHFSDTTVPRYDMVKRMIVSTEGEIDRRLNRSWRENRVVDKVCSINTYQWDENAGRVGYGLRGGNYIKVRKDIRPWDPQKGDRLYIRVRDNQWRDVTLKEMDGDIGDSSVDTEAPHAAFWVDSTNGRIFLRTSMFQTPYNAAKITYRYGSEEPVPEEIRRLASLMVADKVITMGIFNIKVGTGGDISGIKQELHNMWTEEIGSIMSGWQRCGSVHSLLG